MRKVFIQVFYPNYLSFFPQGAERLGYKQTDGYKQMEIIFKKAPSTPTKKVSPVPKRLTKKQQELQGKLHEGSFYKVYLFLSQVM